MIKSDYTIRRMTLKDIRSELGEVVQLQNIVYEGKHTFTIENFERWYVDNPRGNVVSFNAFYGKELVAHYAVIPYDLSINGNVYLGVQSMATVTHPKHRGKGLFKTLAKATYQYAKEQGYKFVIGVANGNSYPGFMKNFPFRDYGQLDVKVGIGSNIYSYKHALPVSTYWNEETLKWRIGVRKEGDYAWRRDILWGKIKVPFFKLIMGRFDKSLLPEDIPPFKSWSWLNPFNLYVGLGANTKRGLYFRVPKWVKHSPFHLIFLDLTDGEFPVFRREDIFFQLIDFDVA